MIKFPKYKGGLPARYFFAGKYFGALKIILGVVNLNVTFEIGEHKFEWDSINLKKHKVAFEEASRIFLDDYRIDDYDELHSDDEERVKTIGFVRNVLAVIYTESGDRNRIISARRANKREETTYYAQFYD